MRAVSALLSVAVSLIRIHCKESTTPPGTPPPSAYRRLHAPSASTAHAQTSTPTPGRSRGDAATASSPSKRRYVPDAADVEVVKKIRQGEVELRDHNTVLRGVKNNVGILSLHSLRVAHACGCTL